jgi:D-alanine-D-alanine ligase
MEVMILAGGLSHERDVSMRSGRRVLDALRDAGDSVTLHDVDADLIPALHAHDIDVVWPIVHGASGEDGSLQGLLEMLSVPYVGTSAKEARVAWVKPVAKAVLSRVGIATPDFVTLPQSLFREVGAEQVLNAIVTRFGLPVVVKPARGGSALGVTLVTDPAQLAHAMVHCFAYGDIALIERAVTGIEVAVAVLGEGESARALPGVEIVCDGPYDYDARYNPGRVEYFAPARLSAAQADAVAETALATHRELGLRDLSRIDVILTEDGTVNVLDINVAPGLTEVSLFPQAVAAAGLDLGALYREILEGAAARGAA